MRLRKMNLRKDLPEVEFGKESYKIIKVAELELKNKEGFQLCYLGGIVFDGFRHYVITGDIVLKESPQFFGQGNEGGNTHIEHIELRNIIEAREIQGLVKRLRK